MPDTKQPLHAKIAARGILSLLFALTFLAVLIVIAVLQLQEEIVHSEIKPPLTIGSVRQGVNVLKKYYADRDSILAAQKASQPELEKDDDASNKSDLNLSDLDRKIRHIIDKSISDSHIPEILAVPYPLKEDTETKDFTDQRRYMVDDLVDHYFTKIAAIRVTAPNSGSANPDGRDAAQVFAAKLRAATEPLLSQYLDAMRQNEELDNSDHQEKELVDGYPTKLSDMDKIFDKSTGRNAAYEDLSNPEFRNLCEEFLNYDYVFGDKAFAIIFTPASDHILALSVIMGILGSLIYISRGIVFDGATPNTGEILFRACLGAAVALAIYLFAGAGMVALGQPGSNPSSGNLSPDLISFLGITAGYLSEHVTDWMAQVGQNFFKVEAGRQRWAIQLQALLTSLALPPAQVAAAIGVPTSDVTDWASLQKAVPPEKQSLLAAYLRTDPAHIYTDIQPA